MITTESHESRKQKAYNAGKDYALGSTDESCHSMIHFQTEEIADEWNRGFEDHCDEQGMPHYPPKVN